MSSLRQIAANRRNALNSTGPTTPEGKERSRRNALRHGLTAETVIAVLEDCEDYQAFEAAVISDYDAELAVERELVLRLASVLWRLRRATGIETALFESVSEEDSRKYEPRLAGANLGAAERNRGLLRAVPEAGAVKANVLGADSKKDIADCSCASQNCRLSPLIASAATSTCCGDKRERQSCRAPRARCPDCCTPRDNRILLPAPC